jgi:hypothetical protein
MDEQEFAPPRFRWYHKLSGLLYVVLCFEVGLFLLFFPWSDYWRPNWMGSWSPEWGLLWMNPYFRGAVSGLGLINVYYSVIEAFQLRRFSAGTADNTFHDNE